MSDASNESGQVPSDSGSPNNAPRSSGSNAIFIRLAILVGLAVAAYFAIPAIMTQIFFQEEVAKTKIKNIVGNDSDMKPPAGVQVYGQPAPNIDEGAPASQPGGGGGRSRSPARSAEDGAKPSEDAKTDDTKKPDGE